MTTLQMPPTFEWTPQALERLPDDYRYEVSEGNLIVMPAAMRPWHARVQYRLVRLFETQGRHAYHEQGIVLGPGEIRTCDVAVFAAEPEGNAAYRPASEFALVVEVVSDSSQRADRQIKPQVYAAAGIPEFWRVEQGSGDEAVVHQFVLRGETYEEQAVVALGELESDFPST